MASSDLGTDSAVFVGAPKRFWAVGTASGFLAAKSMEEVVAGMGVGAPRKELLPDENLIGEFVFQVLFVGAGVRAASLGGVTDFSLSDADALKGDAEGWGKTLMGWPSGPLVTLSNKLRPWVASPGDDEALEVPLTVTGVLPVPNCGVGAAPLVARLASSLALASWTSDSSSSSPELVSLSASASSLGLPLLASER